MNLSDLERRLPGAVDTSPAALKEAAVDCWSVILKERAVGVEHRPDAVVRVRSTAEVQDVLRWASDTGIPVTARGLGSSVTGASVPTCGGVVIDLSDLSSVVELNKRDLYVTAQAGTNGGELEELLNRDGFSLRFSPQSLHRSTVGGWLATRATGQLSSRYGAIEDAVVGLCVVLSDGGVARWMPAARWSAGPDLRQVFIGSEGTLGVITEVSLRIHPLPAHTSLEAVAFPELRDGMEAIRQIARSGVRPSIVRLYDAAEAQHIFGHDIETAVLLLAFEGEAAVVEAEGQVAARFWKAQHGTSLGPDPVSSWLERRYDFSAVEQMLSKPGGVAETIEVSALWSRAEDVYIAMRAALCPLVETVWGHFSHVYPQGTSLYLIVGGQVADDEEALATLRKIWVAAMDACRLAGGSIVHHHGIGLARASWFPSELGSAITVYERIRLALDPATVLAPDKLLGR